MVKCKTITESLQPKVTFVREMSTICFFRVVPRNRYFFPVMSHSSSLEAADRARWPFLPIVFSEPFISVANWFYIWLLNHLPSCPLSPSREQNLFHLQISNYSGNCSRLSLESDFGKHSLKKLSDSKAFTKCLDLRFSPVRTWILPLWSVPWNLLQ